MQNENGSEVRGVKAIISQTRHEGNLKFSRKCANPSLKCSPPPPPPSGKPPRPSRLRRKFAFINCSSVRKSSTTVAESKGSCLYTPRTYLYSYIYICIFPFLFTEIRAVRRLNTPPSAPDLSLKCI